jgi:DNA-binding transcriptional regulator YdaS (Cro superfamily)
MKLKEYYEKGNFRNRADLARFLGVHPSLVTRWLNGDRAISKEKAVLIEKKTQGKVSLRDCIIH